MSRIRINILANAVGGALNALLAIVLVPFYLRYLGIEAYGLVGLFASMQAIFGLLDLGLGLTLNRGLARLAATPGTEVQQRDLLRTMEVIHWTISITLGAAIFVLADTLATHWVNAEHLSRGAVVTAVRLMGVIAALQFPLALYQAGLMGLQRQVLVNFLGTGSTLSRGLITIFILAYVSPTVGAFFITQAAVAFLQTAFTLGFVWKALSVRQADPPRFRRAVLLTEWRFAAAVSANAVIGAFLTQSDKIVLAGRLPLSEFGYYTLAGTVASSLWFAISPVNTAIYPRFTQLLEAGDHDALIELYHTAAQLVATAVVPLALTLILFSREIVLLWTRNPIAADKTPLIIAFLVGGTAVNGLVSVPTYLQSAAGWPQLTTYTNLIAAVVLVPTIVFMAIRYGGPGAAAVWLFLNLCYLFITVPVMHTRLIRSEKWRWYRSDVFLPLVAAVTVGLLFRFPMPVFTSHFAGAAYIGLCAVAMAAATFAVSDRLRGRAAAYVRSRRIEGTNR